MVVVFNDRSACNHCLGENRVKRDGAYKDVIFFLSILLDLARRIGIEVGFVDTDHHRHPEEVSQFGDPLHVVPTGDRGFRHDQRRAGTASGGDDRTTDTRRPVGQDQVQVFCFRHLSGFLPHQGDELA